MHFAANPFDPGRHTRDVSETMDLTIVYALDAPALMLSPEPVEAGDERERELVHLQVT
jgi:hypothetical protein